MSMTVEEARSEPVEEGCLWCKREPEDPVPVGEDEVLCQNCHGDLREFGRTRFSVWLVSSEHEEEAQRILAEQYDFIEQALLTVYDEDDRLFELPTIKSNAENYDAPYNPRERL